MIDALHERLRAVLARTPALRWAILFGSQARGAAGPQSDVDLATATAEPLSAAAEEALIVALERAAGAPVDLVVIERARPALRWRIARDGIVLFPRHPRTRHGSSPARGSSTTRCENSSSTRCGATVLASPNRRHDRRGRIDRDEPR